MSSFADQSAYLGLYPGFDEDRSAYLGLFSKVSPQPSVQYYGDMYYSPAKRPSRVAVRRNVPKVQVIEPVLQLPNLNRRIEPILLPQQMPTEVEDEIALIAFFLVAMN